VCESEAPLYFLAPKLTAIHHRGAKEQMLAHLRFLTRSVLGADPEAQALAVYAEPSGAGFHHVPAAGLDYEGVACVDDAARAVVLYCRLWRSYQYAWLKPTVMRLLNFLVTMQRDDGAFSNFILDWTGQPNLVSSSSFPGGPWWTARAMRALAVGLQTFQIPALDSAFRLGRQWLHQCQSIGALAAAAEAELDYWLVTGDSVSARFCLYAAETIASHHDGHILADDSESPHFWAHHQERALMRVAVAFDQPHLSRIAIESAFELFGPAVVSQFAGRQRTLPYEVSCASCTFDAVYRVSGDPRARELAELAREWFYGRNAAASPVYDPVRQLTYDGIDGESVSSNSGAESNIEAAFALYSVLPWNHLAA